MANPVLVGTQRFGGGFASSVTGSFDVGSDPVSIFAFGSTTANSSLTRINSVTLNPAGTPLVMTALTDRSLNTELSTAGRARGFEALATGLTGTVNFEALATDLSSVSDVNAKPAVFFIWVKDVVSSSTSVMTGPIAVSGSGVASAPAISSATGNLVIGIVVTDGPASGQSGSGGTTKHADGFMGDLQGLSLSKAGASPNVTLQVSTPSTAAFLGQVWNLVGDAASTAPIITGPSGTAGAPSININVAENSTALGTWSATAGATWSISGGADAAQVQISVGGVVTFLAPNDFENPDDVGANRVYNFTVQNVGAGGTSTQDVVATLTNVTELPGAPTVGTATAGNATVTVPFTPPSAGTAPSVIDFTVTLSPGGATKTVSASPAVFTSADGVVNGTAYAGTVTARNSDGTGPASAASNSVTPSFAGPVLSSPTKDTPTATTATLGFSTTGVDGTARAVLIQSTTVPTAPNIAQVKAGQNAAGNSSGVVVPSALAITSAGSKNFAAATVTTGLSYYGFVVHTDAAGNDSDVLSLGVLYPGTARPVSDITTTGWTGSAGGALALLLDEDTADDADFVTSPALSSTPTGLTMAMSKAYGAGTYTGVKAKLWCSTGTCVARIKFLDSGGAVVGTTADITVTTTPTLFTVSVTLTGTAVRWTLEGAV